MNRLYILGLHWKPLIGIDVITLVLKTSSFSSYAKLYSSFLRPNRYYSLATLSQIGVLAVGLAQHSDHSASISLGSFEVSYSVYLGGLEIVL